MSRDLKQHGHEDVSEYAKAVERFTAKQCTEELNPRYNGRLTSQKVGQILRHLHFDGKVEAIGTSSGHIIWRWCGGE